MTEQPPDSLIPYDEIVQEALRAVVGRVLGEVEASGALPGGHHFYITFKTGAAGVDIPKHLSERFPDEMTIVIQNRFWDLKVREDGFEVGLSFNQAPAKLTIPFSAITGFHDPEVNFQLQFQAQDDDG
ncbi:MAG: SspB family protein, partial [Sphingosinicella sp.]|uniref:SspB family protein n=1 Tax=Sphingosinicella sp. TaxID=1917971 RepID=UPI004037D3B4